MSTGNGSDAYPSSNGTASSVAATVQAPLVAALHRRTVTSAEPERGEPSEASSRA